MEKVGLALQQQQHLMRNALQDQNNRILQQQSTLEEISRMLSETKEREDQERATIAKAAQRGKKHINKVYERGFHQRAHDKSLSIH
jgi:regulator of replication initiation timing